MTDWSLNPPPGSAEWYSSFLNGMGQSNVHGFGGSKDFGLSPEVAAHINGLARAVGAFVKNGGITIHIEVERLPELDNPIVVNRPSIKPPMERVNVEFAVRNGQASMTSQENRHGNGFHASNAMHGQLHWQGCQHVVRGETRCKDAPFAGKVDSDGGGSLADCAHGDVLKRDYCVSVDGPNEVDGVMHTGSSLKIERIPL